MSSRRLARRYFQLLEAAMDAPGGPLLAGVCLADGFLVGYLLAGGR